jgi:hypothetical protein
MPIRSLSLLALVFVLSFALQLAPLLFPFQLLEPAWQWRFANALINGAFLPLLSLALLQIGVSLDPADQRLRQRQRLFRQLAVAAALGFVLLLPLQLSAGLRQQSAAGSAQVQRIQGAERRLAQLRQATAAATSNADLNASLLRLNGPVLGPADLANPLPLLKAQVNAVFDQAQAQINRDRAALPPVTATTALPELLRTSLACLLLATAFAGFARRAGVELTLLEEGQRQLRWLRRFRPGYLRRRSNADYIREMAGDGDG